MNGNRNKINKCDINKKYETRDGKWTAKILTMALSTSCHCRRELLVLLTNKDKGHTMHQQYDRTLYYHHSNNPSELDLIELSENEVAQNETHIETTITTSSAISVDVTPLGKLPNGQCMVPILDCDVMNCGNDGFISWVDSEDSRCAWCHNTPQSRYNANKASKGNYICEENHESHEAHDIEQPINFDRAKIICEQNGYAVVPATITCVNRLLLELSDTNKAILDKSSKP